jgi:hypothetical protein
MNPMNRAAPARCNGSESFPPCDPPELEELAAAPKKKTRRRIVRVRIEGIEHYCPECPGRPKYGVPAGAAVLLSPL